jgi:hypothetical protein
VYQRVFGAEVILHGGLVRHARLDADATQRHPVETVLREQPLGGQHKLLLGRRSDRKRGRLRHADRISH